MSVPGRRGRQLPLFTIGHSTHPLHRFLALLDRHRIECLVWIPDGPAVLRQDSLGLQAAAD